MTFLPSNLYRKLYLEHVHVSIILHYFEFVCSFVLDFVGDLSGHQGSGVTSSIIHKEMEGKKCFEVRCPYVSNTKKFSWPFIFKKEAGTKVGPDQLGLPVRVGSTVDTAVL